MLLRLRVSLRQVVNQMARRPALLCGAIVLSCSLILAITFTCSETKQVVFPAQPPTRFFSPDSPVVDLYLGQLDEAESLRSASEVSLLYFYAPWCGQSISARGEIEQVARKLAHQVQFVAVNCWWNQGKCRKQNNFYHYPVIYLYHRRFGPIEYNGPITAAYVEKFIRRVITPLQYVPSRAGLQDFLSHYEPGVLGYFEFNASPQPPGYLTFLTSALQALRRDFQGVMRFGVITSKQVAKAISLDAPGTVYMHRHFNTSLTFPSHVLNFTSENICRWALEHREWLVRWLRPHGGKSRALEQELRKGAALIIFLPFDPLAPSQPLVEEVAEIAVQYHSCNGSSWPGFMEPEVWGEPGSLSRAPCCNTLALPHWLSVSRTHNVCELCLDQALGPWHCPSLDSLYLREDFFTQPLSGNVQCSHVLSSSSPLDYYTACCWSLSKGSSTQQDRRSVLPHIEDRGSASAHSAVKGLKCRTNKTLNFYLLDSGLHWEFARRLGAPENASMMGFATVLNLQDEVHHVLNQDQGIVRNTLESFIQNYSIPYSPLQRHLVGEAAREPVGESLITTVTTRTFHRAVMDPEKDVLLFYYTQWCGFCSALNHVIIQLARLSLSNPRLAVCRINAAKNDLPWEFMVDRYPTILFFPSDRKHQSVKYPEDSPITLPNLVRFVQRHSSPLHSSSSSAFHQEKEPLLHMPSPPDSRADTRQGESESLLSQNTLQEREGAENLLPQNTLQERGGAENLLPQNMLQERGGAGGAAHEESLSPSDRGSDTHPEGPPCK
ncbi:thioredoxin domain-containing protein 11 [Huso huso]|uniref:Thioredoxin domain-containing protein 11 n=1 Tax=Huso huso TaxID=61971 RepID=A0ABR0Z9S7_HUSHU